MVNWKVFDSGNSDGVTLKYESIEWVTPGKFYEYVECIAGSGGLGEIRPLRQLARL